MMISQEHYQFLTTELARLRAWKERAMPIVQAMSAKDEESHGSVTVCHYNCGAYTSSLKEIPLLHLDDCPIVQARALLAEAQAS